MMPVLLDETLAHLFVFYQDGALYRGLRSQTRLYKMVRSFGVSRRSTAFNLGVDLCEKGVESLITVSSEGYKVWVDLQAIVACEGKSLIEHSHSIVNPDLLAAMTSTLHYANLCPIDWMSAA